MTGGLLIGVDIGTYSSKGVLTTPQGEILASRALEHGMSIPRPGWAEHDPETVWWAEFCALCRRLTERDRAERLRCWRGGRQRDWT